MVLLWLSMTSIVSVSLEYTCGEGEGSRPGG